MGQVNVCIRSMPSQTPEDSHFYLGANLNDWRSDDPRFRFQREGDQYCAAVDGPPDSVMLFKVTRGDWKKVERDANGSDIPNRKIVFGEGSRRIDVDIAQWSDLIQRKSTRTGVIEILEMPFRNAQRRVWVYLPPSYAQEPNKRYPVLYMHDGQNLFDAKTSTYGREWKIDETMERLSRQDPSSECIVVGMENGQSERMNEYSPWKTEVDFDLSRGQGGLGDVYGDFVVAKLKPGIDARYRTIADRDHTFIGGSSMGGLISCYMALKHQDTFSRALIFSPAFWFAKSKLLEFISQTQVTRPLKIHVSVGTMEVAGADAKTYVRDAQDISKALQDRGGAKVILKQAVIDGGLHCEDAWADLFPHAFGWLMKK